LLRKILVAIQAERHNHQPARTVFPFGTDHLKERSRSNFCRLPEEVVVLGATVQKPFPDVEGRRHWSCRQTLSRAVMKDFSDAAFSPEVIARAGKGVSGELALLELQITPR
jgi:hypothetical protein